MRRLPFIIAIGCLAAVRPVLAEPAKIDQLVIRSWPGPWDDAMVEVGQKFTALTGIAVAYDHRVDGVMATLIQAALAQGRPPPVDVFYTFDVDAKKAQLRGILEPLTVEDIPNLEAMLPMAKPPSSDAIWPYINVGADIVTLLYRADKFPNGPPTSYNVLVDPAFKGRIFLYTVPQFTMSAVALANGWNVPADLDKIWGFVQDKVKPQNAILGNDPEIVGGFQRNEIDVTVSYPTIARQLASDGIKTAKAKEGLIGGYETVAIPRGLAADHRYWAAQFINTLLSADVLQSYCQRLMIACLRQNMVVTDAEQQDPAFPKTPEELAGVFNIPLDLFAAHESEWTARYDEILK